MQKTKRKKEREKNIVGNLNFFSLEVPMVFTNIVSRNILER